MYVEHHSTWMAAPQMVAPAVTQLVSSHFQPQPRAISQEQLLAFSLPGMLSAMPCCVSHHTDLTPSRYKAFPWSQGNYTDLQLWGSCPFQAPACLPQTSAGVSVPFPPSAIWSDLHTRPLMTLAAFMPLEESCKTIVERKYEGPF